MGPALPIISAVASLVGGVKAYSDSRRAAKEQKKLAALNAANIQAEGARSQEVAGLEEAQRSGTALARMGASGLTPSGSMAMWEEAQRKQFEEEMGWLGQSTTSQATAAAASGNAQAAATRAQGTASLFGGISSAAGTPGLKIKW